MGVPAALPDLEHWKAQVKCQTGCPVRTDAGRYVQLIADGRDREAYLVARAPNPFASVCGRVCAAPCEDACRRGTIDAPIPIRALKRYVTEQYGVESIRPDTQDALREPGPVEGNRYAGHYPATAPDEASATKRKVAVIGAGPAGLAAAHDLALGGYAVTVFEAGAEAAADCRTSRGRPPRCCCWCPWPRCSSASSRSRQNRGKPSSSSRSRSRATRFSAARSRG